MPVQVANAARRDPRRPRVLPSAAISRRGELTAALATAAVVAQVVIAPVTLLVSIVLAVVGRVARWRPGWLAAPALAWLTWTSYQPVDRAGPGRRLALVISLHWGFGLLPAVLVVPYSTKATESSLAQVPTGYREDAEALGLRPSWTPRKIVLKAATPGIVTGLLVAIAISVGETAPLLLTADWSESEPTMSPPSIRLASLPTLSSTSGTSARSRQ